MTTAPAPDDRLADVLRVYAEHPLDEGDAVLLIDDEVCLELEGLADEWDQVLRSTSAQILLSTADRVLVAIARPSGVLLDSPVQLLPVRALPAA
jgi:hypothetical protein